MKQVDLKYDYTLEGVSNSTVTQNLLTPDMGDRTAYVISQDAGNIITFFLYESGLAVYTHTTSEKVVFKTNFPFIANENGDLVVAPT